MKWVSLGASLCVVSTSGYASRPPFHPPVCVRFTHPICSLCNDAPVPRCVAFGGRKPPCLSKTHLRQIVGTFVLEVIHIHHSFRACMSYIERGPLCSHIIRFVHVLPIHSLDANPCRPRPGPVSTRHAAVVGVLIGCLGVGWSPRWRPGLLQTRPSPSMQEAPGNGQH